MVIYGDLIDQKKSEYMITIYIYDYICPLMHCNHKWWRVE